MAFPDAGVQCVAEQVTDQPGFTVDYLQCPFGAGGNTLPTPGEFFLNLFKPKLSDSQHEDVSHLVFSFSTASGCLFIRKQDMTHPHPAGGEETPCLSGGILYVPEPWRGAFRRGHMVDVTRPIITRWSISEQRR